MNEIIAKTTINVLSEVWKAVITNLFKKDDKKEIDTVERLSAHLNEIANWSSTIQFFGMSREKGITSSTISLSILSEPRRLIPNTDQSARLTEKDLLIDRNHCLILGDPGSGKTTTIKRIIQNFFFSETISHEDDYQYPLLIMMRNLTHGLDITKQVANIIGIEYEVREIKYIDREGKDAKRYEYYYNDKLLIDFIAGFLNQTKCFLLIDGLDEIDLTTIKILEAEINELSLKLNECKMIVTMRSGDYSFEKHIGGLSVLELCPLSHNQIIRIAKKWVDDPSSFLKTIKDKPYYDLVDRPLFLTHILVLFQKYGYLPEQPADVYHRIIRLILEEWDAQRGIRRVSRYGGFNSDRKIKFLSALSYRLTYIKKSKEFSHDELIHSYNALRMSFDLPINEAEKVANEIESHTGLIIKSFGDKFEFSHLSLQEYLCANYLVSMPISDILGPYIEEYPAPVALATAISSEPGLWFSNLISTKNIYLRLSAGSLKSFLSRLLLEKPIFQRSDQLGISTICLLSDYAGESSDLDGVLWDLYNNKIIKVSVNSIVKRFYQFDHLYNNRNSVLLKIRPSSEPTGQLYLPNYVGMPKEFYDVITG